MRNALVLTALFLLAPLAGCLGGGTATANDLTPRARALAQAWQPDATLQAVAGVELKELPPVAKAALAQASAGDDSSPELQLMQFHDGNVGDGRAAAWMFGFRSGAQALLLVLDAGGREVARHVTATGSDGEQSLGEVAIDSDQAMDLAAKENGTFARAREHAFVATLALVPTPAGPFWMLMLAGGFGSLGDSDARGDSAFAMVDATSGNVTSDEFAGSMASAYGGSDYDGSSSSAPAAYPSPYHRPRGNHTFLKTETGSEQGTLTVLSPDQGSPFEVAQAGHGQLRLQLTLPNGAPPTQATATVTGPDGRTATVTFAAGVGGQAPATAQLDAPVAGEYKLAVHLDAGVLQKYAFEWCAPGSRMSAFDGGSACGEA
ncbi:MAG: hypothetical protein QOI63_1086 [Thermoplasmata archaeon]|jgi:hypothetical protein|nr:hypothetical protein [Thermoplasmata archaeon]